MTDAVAAAALNVTASDETSMIAAGPIWATHHSPGTKDVAQLVKFPCVDDPRDFERCNPRLTMVEEILLSSEP